MQFLKAIGAISVKSSPVQSSTVIVASRPNERGAVEAEVAVPQIVAEVAVPQIDDESLRSDHDMFRVSKYLYFCYFQYDEAHQ